MHNGYAVKACDTESLVTHRRFGTGMRSASDTRLSKDKDDGNSLITIRQKSNATKIAAYY